ncbi:MAG TPA: hypothetical protein VKU85_10305, partial [bacterium]|nr:hypothetical protein [bacterium]
MKADRPPRGLPPGYLRLWRALVQADADASSRAELARRLNVSTHTIQRILVDGTPPDFRKAQGRRLVLSWARTLARLARGLESEARPWIEAVGIGWDDDVRKAAESELVRASSSRSGSQSGTEDTLGRIRARAATGDPEPVRAGVVPFGPYESFFRAWVDRLVGAVDPGWDVRWIRASAEEIGAKLRTGELDVGAGLFETPALRASGLELLPVPGLRPGLRAVVVRPTAEEQAPGDGAAADRHVPGWPELLETDAHHVLLVREGDPAASLARRQWNLPAERVIQRRRPTAAALAEEAFAEAKRRGTAIILLADEITVHAARTHL